MEQSVENTKLKPPLSLVINAVLLIGVCLWVTGSLAYSMIVSENPFMLLGGLFFVLVPPGIGIFQYFSVFRGKTTVATLLAILLIAPGVITMLWFVSILHGNGYKPDLEVLTLLCVSLFLFYSATVNLLWAKKHNNAIKIGQLTATPIPGTKILDCIIIAAFVIALAGGTVLGFKNYGKYESGENAATVKWLPVSATNISYYLRPSFTAYEFDIPEDDFKALASNKKWEIKPIADKEMDIPRWNHFIKSSRIEDDESYYEPRPVIKQGYYYECRYEDGGGTTVYYDSEKQRAYYQSNPR